MHVLETFVDVDQIVIVERDGSGDDEKSVQVRIMDRTEWKQIHKSKYEESEIEWEGENVVSIYYCSG